MEFSMVLTEIIFGSEPEYFVVNYMKHDQGFLIMKADYTLRLQLWRRRDISVPFPFLRLLHNQSLS